MFILKDKLLKGMFDIGLRSHWPLHFGRMQEFITEKLLTRPFAKLLQRSEVDVNHGPRPWFAVYICHIHLPYICARACVEC